MNEEALERIRNGQYKDRGMVKWRAFASMPEQYIGLTKVCYVRMHNDAVAKLFDKVKVGTPVTITNSYRSFEKLTKLYGYAFKGYNTK
ncbi:L,D-transpeptidase [Priestia megaterium]|uniref:L,D-transpeptidase n=1 Tax=Priestia megaterium TaxID=1404 RepID=UPI002FFF72FC